MTMMELYDGEFVFWMCFFAFVCAVYTASDVYMYFREKQRQREKRKAEREQQRADMERRSELRLRRVQREIRAEVDALHRRKNCGGSSNVKIVGAHSGAYSAMTGAERAAVISGIMAKADDIRKGRNTKQIRNNKK